MGVHTFIFPDPVEEIELEGTDASLVRFDDAEGPAAYGFKHRCTEWDDEAEDDGRFVKIVAPRLSKHTVTRNGDLITVRASIACVDCKMHGFVTDNKWKDA